MFENYFEKKNEKQKKTRYSELSKKSIEELEAIRYENTLSIERLNNKIVSTRSAIYGLWCKYEADFLKWENEQIDMILETK